MEASSSLGYGQYGGTQARRADALHHYAFDGENCRRIPSGRNQRSAWFWPRPEAGKLLASSARVDKVAFTGETTTGQLIMQYASKNLNPVTMELGGKSPNIFFNSVMDEDDAYLNKAIEGAVLFAFNQGEVCTCH